VNAGLKARRVAGRLKSAAGGGAVEKRGALMDLRVVRLV